MKIYSYVVARDFGFAPNPFFGFCTLSACKPDIRKSAQIGDWIVGTGSNSIAHRIGDQLVYAMQVTEAKSFDEYWQDPRFKNKKPVFNKSVSHAFGDNIYYHDTQGNWIQLNSHHSFADGSMCIENLNTDTAVDRVLISNVFIYFGGNGPEIPQCFRNYNGYDICKYRQGYKSDFPEKMKEEFIEWVKSLGTGIFGTPLDWD